MANNMTGYNLSLMVVMVLILTLSILSITSSTFVKIFVVLSITYISYRLNSYVYNKYHKKDDLKNE